MRACWRHYGVQTEIASLFATFGIFSRHRKAEMYDSAKATRSTQRAQQIQIVRRAKRPPSEVFAASFDHSPQGVPIARRP